MAVDDPKTVDLVGTCDTTDHVILTISDHLPWGDQSHLSTLQDKMNSYLSFIESGEIFEEYPQAKGRHIKIEVALKFTPDVEGLEFLQKAGEIIENAGFGLSFYVLET